MNSSESVSHSHFYVYVVKLMLCNPPQIGSLFILSILPHPPPPMFQKTNYGVHTSPRPTVDRQIPKKKWKFANFQKLVLPSLGANLSIMPGGGSISPLSNVT